MPTLITTKVINNAKSFDLGVNKTAGTGKQVTAQWTGTFEVGDKFNLRLGESNYGFLNKPVAPVSFLATFGKKIYAVSDSLLQFCAIDKPRDWDTVYGLGAGFINLFNSFTGGEKLKALAAYAGKLAIFARNTIQVWSMDVDPARNQQLQVLDNIGTIAPRSVQQIGDVDVFFLADSGIRSLRSRDVNNIAFSADIGNPVDELVTADMRALGADAENAIGVIEPTEGRYWLILGGKIYVFSHFSSSQVSAWSTYETDFDIVDAVSFNGRLYLFGDNHHLYVYGGLDGATYDGCEVEGELPFLSTGTPATMKSFTAFDAVVEGEWSFSLGTNPEAADERDVIGSLWAPSFDMRRIPIDAQGTHFSATFTNSTPGYARLSNLIVHYNPHEAG
jgi:hypothetical protein